MCRCNYVMNMINNLKPTSEPYTTCYINSNTSLGFHQLNAISNEQFLEGLSPQGLQPNYSIIERSCMGLSENLVLS